MKNIICRSLIIQSALVFCALFVCAAGNIHIGSFEIHLFESFNQTYNDNIFLEPENQENGDQITKSKLGLLVQKKTIPGRDFLFKAKYWADVFQYNNNTKEDRVDHFVEADMRFVFARRLTLTLSEDFKKTADPPNSELTNLEKRLRNINEAVLGYKTGRFRFDVSSRFVRDNYDNFSFLDKKEYITSQTLLISISPKTYFFGEYVFGKIKYDKSTSNVDSEYTQVRGGIKGKLAPKLTGIIKGGYKVTDYDDSRTIEGRDFKGGTFFASIIYKPRERSRIELYGDRTSIESTYLTNNYYVRNRGGGRFEQKLMRKVFLTGGGSYQLNTYPEELTDSGFTAKRRDNLRAGEASVRYEFKSWIHIHGGYSYKEKDSNFNQFNYKNNIYSGKISLQF